MPNKRIRIAATDGESTVAVGSIRFDEHIIISAIAPRDAEEPRHETYYKNGYMHFSPMEATMKVGFAGEDKEEVEFSEAGIYYGPSIDEFQGMVQGGLTTISREIEAEEMRPFEEGRKQFNHVTYIDTRPSKEGICYRIILCEPGFRIGELLEERKNATGCTELSCNLYTAVTPWVGVVTWPREQPDPNIEPVGEFRSMIRQEIERVSDSYRIRAPTCQNGYHGCEGTAGDGDLCRDCMNELTGFFSD
jgi:hypothetical protein